MNGFNILVFVFLQFSVLFHNTDLKTPDTFGDCQRPVFSLGVSQHMLNITNLWNLNSIGCRSCEIIMEEKTPLYRPGLLTQVWTETIQYGSSMSWSVINTLSLIDTDMPQMFPFFLNFVAMKTLLPSMPLFCLFNKIATNANIWL